MSKEAVVVDENYSNKKTGKFDDDLEARQYCGEILYDTLEYYCVHLKGAVPIVQAKLKELKSKRSDNISNDNQPGNILFA